MKQRLRRKFHTDDFAELGFVVKANLEGADEAQRMDGFLGPFIEFLDGQRLYAGGYCSEKEAEFFVQRDGVPAGAWTRHARGARASTTEDDRGTVQTWLKGQSVIKTFDVGPLTDAWYEHGV